MLFIAVISLNELTKKNDNLKTNKNNNSVVYQLSLGSCPHFLMQRVFHWWKTD